MSSANIIGLYPRTSEVKRSIELRANYCVYRSSIIEEPISTDRSVDATERRRRAPEPV